MKDTHPLSSLTYLFLYTQHAYKHTLFLSLSRAPCLRVSPTSSCRFTVPSVTNYQGPVCRRDGEETLWSPNRITPPLLITGGPRRVDAMLATRINSRIWRAACLSTPLISAYTHPHTDWFNTGCQLRRGLQGDAYVHNHKHGAAKIRRSVVSLDVNTENTQREKGDARLEINFQQCPTCAIS